MNSKVIRCKLIASVLISDGIMTAEEKEFLSTCMEELGLDEGEREQVFTVEPGDDILPLARSLTEAERHQVRDLLVRAALADGKLSPYEMKVVAEVTQALGLGEQE